MTNLCRQRALADSSAPPAQCVVGAIANYSARVTSQVQSARSVRFGLVMLGGEHGVWAYAWRADGHAAERGAEGAACARGAPRWESTQRGSQFLMHFCGDIHQPLHVSFASNYGGNDITVRLRPLVEPPAPYGCAAVASDSHGACVGHVLRRIREPARCARGRGARSCVQRTAGALVFIFCTFVCVAGIWDYNFCS